MSKKKLLLVDLQEDQAKKVAKAITNSKCRKILNLLADKDYTASQLSKKLNLPLSTIHYNLNLLVESELVIADEYHYSKKMKEILHYKLANQYVVIGTKKQEGFNLKEKLMNLLPAISIVGSIGIGSLIYNYLLSLRTTPEATLLATADAEMVRTYNMQEVASEPNIWLWFVLGGVVFSLLYLLFEYIKYKRGINK